MQMNGTAKREAGDNDEPATIQEMPGQSCRYLFRRHEPEMPTKQDDLRPPHKLAYCVLLFHIF